MKQFYITTQNLNLASDTDCVLPETDPARELIAQGQLGGLAARAAYLAQVQANYKKRLEKIDENYRNRPNFPK